MFRWLGPFPTHDQDLLIRTSGKKVLFWAFGKGPSTEHVGESQGKCENNALGNMTVFGSFLGGPWMAILCQKRSPRTAYSSAVLFSETLFLRRGPLFRKLGPRVSLIRTFSKTQRTYSNETPCIWHALVDQTFHGQ